MTNEEIDFIEQELRDAFRYGTFTKLELWLMDARLHNERAAQAAKEEPADAVHG